MLSLGMDPTQILLFAVVITLTLLLVIVGIQVFLILKETRRAIKKTNKLLDEANDFLPSIRRPVMSATNMFEAFKNVKHIIDFAVREGSGLLSRKKTIHQVAEDVFEEAEIPTRPRRTSILAKSKRVFKRGGRPLSN